MSKVFLGVPTNYVDRINELPKKEFAIVYRAIRHTGGLVPEDFYPTFADEEQLRSISLQMNKGGMSRTIAEQIQNHDLTFYALSLSDDWSEAKRRFQGSEAKKRKFPQMAEGFTTLDKGVATKLTESHHVDYFLYDYVSKEGNPVMDFVLVTDNPEQIK